MAEVHTRLSKPVQRWLFKQGWRALRPVQAAATEPILGGKQDIVIAAGTAAGKTEAAFLPILSRLNLEDEQGLAESGCRVLYIAPLKALINDQYGRIEDMTEGMQIPVLRWHGDVGTAPKQAFTKRPDGILQITPESLEAILMRRGHQAPKLFGALRYMVIDELHAFIGSERGKQLQSLLHRIERLIGRHVPRIGLSATLGDPELAVAFIRPGSKAILIEEKGGGSDIRLQLRGYRASAPNMKVLAEGSPDGGDATEQIATHLFEVLRGSNNLIFANRRQQVEQLADKLRERSEKMRVPNEFHPHHGSLAKELREQVEDALKQETRPVTVVCTSTLEMGIDIGWMKSIAQVGVPPSVASMRQRLGRSGRRGEPAVLRIYLEEEKLSSQSSLSDALRVGTVQAAAMVRLLVRGWIEPPWIAGLHLSTLAHQILALIAQYGGITARHAWDILCADGPFANIEQTRFIELLRSMGTHELIEQSDGGLLLHGHLGERLAGHYSFYAVFPAPEEFVLYAGDKRLGSLPIDRPLLPDSYLIFAGRRWRVLRVDTERHLIELAPAPSGKAPPFNNGVGRLVADEIREEMRRLYLDDGEPEFLDSRVEDRFPVSLDLAYPFPPLSSGGAS
ncbi:MAG: DEAD/DEAH box helicase, partial [Candidatus Thiosymbion ectosymbiont of Robbea hypermnestra]|nr:DEAD/DEAH box helicase [Candidatus Thiosymbion ectosymbiont of Robbea hypermnestra]